MHNVYVRMENMRVLLIGTYGLTHEDIIPCGPSQ